MLNYKQIGSICQQNTRVSRICYKMCEFQVIKTQNVYIDLTLVVLVIVIDEEMRR